MNSPAPHIDALAERRLAARPASAASEIALSDSDIAERFVQIHRHEVRYAAEWGRWLYWSDGRWQHDKKLRVQNLVRGVCHDLRSELCNGCMSPDKERRQWERFGSLGTFKAVMGIAGADPAIAITADQLDSDPMALNTPGGIVDLSTGAIRPHDPAELHTKITTAAPRGECPLFEQTLERVLPDAEERDYLQRLAGMSLIGRVRDHVLPFAYGDGGAGKGTVFHALKHALGNYAISITSEMLMESQNPRHLTEHAQLCGVRLAIGSEVNSGCRWSETTVKKLTGGDTIRANFMHRDHFEFEPSHTLVVFGNNKPSFRSVDRAIRRRVHLIHFPVSIPADEVDEDLPEKLQAEAGGILAWAIVGCINYLEIGLSPPDSILAATEDYLSAEDSVGQWMAECTTAGGCLTHKAAHASYAEWCNTNSMPPLGRNTFAEQLENRGVRVGRDTRNKTKVFEGIQLRTQAGSGRHEY